MNMKVYVPVNATKYQESKEGRQSVEMGNKRKKKAVENGSMQTETFVPEGEMVMRAGAAKGLHASVVGTSGCAGEDGEMDEQGQKLAGETDGVVVCDQRHRQKFLDSNQENDAKLMGDGSGQLVMLEHGALDLQVALEKVQVVLEENNMQQEENSLVRGDHNLQLALLEASHDSVAGILDLSVHNFQLPKRGTKAIRAKFPSDKELRSMARSFSNSFHPLSDD